LNKSKSIEKFLFSKPQIVGKISQKLYFIHISKKIIKAMKKLVIVLCLISQLGWAQDKEKTSHKVKFSGAGKKVELIVYQAKLQVQGIEGDEVIIELENDENCQCPNMPEEARGLRPLSASGTSDNTGIGVNIQQEGNTLKVTIPKGKYFGPYLIKIPKNLGVEINEKVTYGSKWNISNIAGEVNINAGYTNVRLEDVSGPVIAHMGYGKINVVYNKLNPSTPNSITSSGAIDITLPADTKANLKLKAYYGEVFTDFDMNLNKGGLNDRDEPRQVGGFATSPQPPAAPPAPQAFLNSSVGTTSRSGAVERGAARSTTFKNDWNAGDSYMGTINGGGVEIALKSSYGNIYVRKKK
jgi:Putative adhesin